MSNWTIIRNDTVQGSKKQQRVVKNFKNLKTMSAEELKKYGNELYDAKIAREDALIAASAENKLKSKTLIAEAGKIQKEREKKAKNKKEASAE